MTIHDPSLRAALKTLKLTGMLDTLDARLAQTRDGQLGHLGGIVKLLISRRCLEDWSLWRLWWRRH